MLPLSIGGASMSASDSLSAAGHAGEERAPAGSFDVWYRPKVDLKRKCLAGAEAFAHPANVADAEHAEQALLSMMRDWAAFAEAGFNLHFACAVTAEALLRLPIAQFVRDNRPKTKDWPGLTLQIAEEQIVREVDRTQAVAIELSAIGVKIGIDTFGASFSSFASLRKIPFAEIKIDPMFVKNCAVDVSNAAICQTAIDLAHRFSSTAVADGIETMQDLQGLIAMGCDVGQGALIGAPLPRTQFLELLQRRLNKRPAQPQAPEPTGQVA